VAHVAAFADIDVASGKLERRIGPHALHLFDGRGEPVERRDLDDATNGDGDEDADEQQD
jgi:hypothetical protein